MKTALLLPTNSVDYQKVVALLSTVLVFKVAQNQYAANRKHEDSLDKRGQEELENCKREAKIKLQLKEYDGFKDEFHRRIDEKHDLLSQAVGHNNPTRTAQNKQVVKVTQSPPQQAVEYLQVQRGLSPVEKLFQLDTDMAYSMYLNLVIGMKEATSYLIGIFGSGYGAVKNEFLAYLCMAIGVKLGDQETIEIVASDPLPENAKKLAVKCVTQIKKNAKEIGNKQITYQEAIGYGKIFDQIVKANSEHSFEANLLQGGWVKEFAQFVKVVDGSSSTQASSSGYTESSSLLGGQGQHNNADDSCCIIL